jgi:sigma-B regulation protein RsbU (phosphoserine phosphatase)
MGQIFKILVTDDSSAIRGAVQHMLIENNADKYIVVTASNGKEACEIADTERPDLILIDIEMPVMGGIEAISIIKQNENIKSIPIIVMSSTRFFQDAILAGADDFLLKPFNQYELLLRVQFNIKLSIETAETKKQHELLKMQKQEVVYQRDTIMCQQKELLDDLQYASYIQKAILPRKTLIEENCKSYFIFNKPKKIVSGDFYWVFKKNEYLVIALGDCTGHGISGALMTMAGIAFLNEIMSQTNTFEANTILNDLRSKVIKLLHQKGTIGETSNGMDVALCIFNLQTREIEFAGANNPMYISRNGQSIEIIKADRMPIGIHINHENPFSKKNLTLGNNDVIYLFSDGYADQFGGERGQKYRYNRFQDLLLEISLKPMNQQQQILESTINEWMVHYEQVDDILILGLKL